MPPGSAGNSIRISTGPAPDWTSFFENDPFYKQNIADLTASHGLTLTRTAEDQARDESLFALDRDLAERTNRQRERYLREFAASRGMVDSGQLGAEQSERLFQFQNQMGQKQIQQDADIAGFGRTRENANLNFAQGKGAAAFALYERLKADGRLNAPGKMALWDEESQLYVTSDGEYYDAYGNLTSWTRPGTPGPSAGDGSYQPAPGAGPTSSPGFYESDIRSQPLENVVPGAPWRYA